MQKTPTQLLNPNRRISEVAYDAGFRSLTEFHRTVNRVFGQSPTEFRAHVASHSPRREGST
ncbi:MAG: helix-turn-helix domain-containing protein, partial [Verrucomicrobiota bacterium]|nr:helix-turn-helix domain-containing protein [Verrucomicrobiota bacterium]